MTGRPTRATTGGSIYLDLRKLAATTSRPTNELLQLYALEGFLDRLSRSPHADRFVLKGGILLAVYDARRPTRDVDLAALDVSNDLANIHGMVNDIISIERDDGLAFDTVATTVDAIHEDQAYGGVRVKVHGTLSTGRIRFHVDVNVGDPLWPPPDHVDLPRVLGGPPIRLRGYRIELVLAEKIVTALQRGTANTRWRDFVDIASLSKHAVDPAALVEAITSVAEYRQVSIRPLGEVLSDYAPLAQARWVAWRRKQRLVEAAPPSFADLLDQVIAFSDPMLSLAASPG